jgi:polyisoprenyl-phosphate glycosyltransferase
MSRRADASGVVLAAGLLAAGLAAGYLSGRRAQVAAAASRPHAGEWEEAAASAATPDPVLSVVIPIHNEQDCLGELHRRLTAVLERLGLVYEVILVDDGSSDGSTETIRHLASVHPVIHGVVLSRNFGHQLAVTAGLHRARGEAVVVMDADLQDPPEIIPELVAEWEAGHEVVAAVREAREGETRFKQWTAAAFYRLLRRLTGLQLPVDAGDFRLLDRCVVDALREMPEQHRFVRGLTTWVGFRQTTVTYRRAARYAGETKYPLRRMVRLATSAVTSFSDAPLQLSTLFGFGAALAGLIAVPVVIVARLLGVAGLRGQTTVLVAVLVLCGLDLIAVGILGSYVGRLYDEAKRRPLYIVWEEVEADQLTTPAHRDGSSGPRSRARRAGGDG